MLETGILCQACRELFTDATRTRVATSYDQFKTREGLEKSSDEGCNLCSGLLFGINQGYIPQPEHDCVLLIRTNLRYPHLQLVLFGLHLRSSDNHRRDIVINVDTHLQKKIPGPHSFSEQSLSFVSHSIDQCISTHEICGEGKHHRLPKRIVSIGLKPSHSIKLIEGSQIRARYACLSHCWGNTRTIETTNENIAQHNKNIAWSSLPRTYRDAITFCRGLKIKYLWIDSLCIIQNDKKDWEEEASKMASVYANSFITLAATSAPHHHAPCVSQLGPQNHLKEIGRIGSNNAAEYFPILVREAFLHPDNMTDELPQPVLDKKTFPLLHRAWVYQERILSPRVLHFLPNELLWECRCRVECECREIDSASSDLFMLSSPKLLLHHDFRPTDTENDCAQCKVGQMWQRFLKDYLELELTFPKDKLTAISGLTRQIQQTRRDRYLAGLWESDMPDALFWLAPLVNSSVPRPQVDHPPPTWSWASIVGGRVFSVYSCPKCSGSFEYKFPMKFIRANVQPATVDLYGPVEEGAEVVILAKASSGTLHYGADQCYVVLDQISKEIPFDPDYDFRSPGRYHIPDGATVTCAYRGIVESISHGARDWLDILVLRVVNLKEGKYERLGYTRIRGTKDRWGEEMRVVFSSMPSLMKTIRLV